MVIPIEILQKTNIKQHRGMVDKINEIVDVVNGQGLETIKDTVNDVKARVGVLETENDNQDTEITQLGTRVTAVEQKNTTQDSQISEVTGRMTTAETKITALENDKADATDVTALGNRVTAVENKNTTQDTEISQLGTRVTAVEQKNTAQDSQISDVTGRMTTAETKITALEDGTVKTEGNQTIDGLKTFMQSLYIHSPAERGTLIYRTGDPINGTWRRFRWDRTYGYDAEGTAQMLNQIMVTNDTNVTSSFFTSRNVMEDGTGVEASIVVRAYTDGSTQATAPAPPASANGTEIATAKWVNDKIDNKIDKTAVATASTLGLVKIGSGINVSADGTISATGGGGGNGLTILSLSDYQLKNMLIKAPTGSGLFLADFEVVGNNSARYYFTAGGTITESTSDSDPNGRYSLNIGSYGYRRGSDGNETAVRIASLEYSTANNKWFVYYWNNGLNNEVASFSLTGFLVIK